MRKFLLLIPLVLGLALTGVLTTPKPAEATLVTCSPLAVISTHGNYQTLAHMCEDWSSDHQSIRAYAGIEFRYGGVRHSVGRFDFNHLKLCYGTGIPFNCAYVRDDDKGIIPSTGFTDGFSVFGSWFNPGGCGLHEISFSTEEGNAVRYSDNYLDSNVAGRDSAFADWNYNSCS